MSAAIRLPPYTVSHFCFVPLRNTANLEGKCGDCEYRNLCGGSRSRSYALTGNFLAEEPRCVYVPKETGVGHQRPGAYVLP